MLPRSGSGSSESSGNLLVAPTSDSKVRALDPYTSNCSGLKPEDLDLIVTPARFSPFDQIKSRSSCLNERKGVEGGQREGDDDQQSSQEMLEEGQEVAAVPASGPSRE